MADDNSLESALMDNTTSGGLSSAVGDNSAPAASPQPAATPQAPDLPRFQRTFGNTLKGIMLGFGMGGVPGAVEGGIDPQKQIEARDNARATAQANVTFANARAAHEVAMAHQADAEYQALPEKLKQEADARGLDNLARAKQAGYLPVASVPLDQGQDQNSQNAMTALNSVKSHFGAVPQGLLYIHTGNGMTVMKLQDPNAALPMINQARRAQGMPELPASAFATLSPQDRDSMSRDAINFTDPRDPVSGQISQASLNIANMRLQTIKAQPQFDGKDALVSQLQNTVDHQKQVLDSGATQEATRKGQAAGAEAQAAQPGTTAAKVADIKATAGPEAAAAGQKAEAVAKGTAEGTLNATGGATATGTINPQTGADEGYLSSLPPAQANQIRAIGEGRVELNSRTMASKDGKVLMQQLTTAYPGFDQSKAQSYFKMRQDFTSGKTSTAINAYNTGIAHLGDMYDHVSNSNSAMINMPGTEVHRQLDLDKQLVSTELAKAVSNGNMTEGEQEAIMKKISGATVNSYKERIKEAVTLLDGKLNAYDQQWKNGAPPGAVSQVQVLSPQSKATIAKINGQAQPQAAPQGRAVRDAKGNILGYTTDGKTMTRAQ